MLAFKDNLDKENSKIVEDSYPTEKASVFDMILWV